MAVTALRFIKENKINVTTIIVLGIVTILSLGACGTGSDKPAQNDQNVPVINQEPITSDIEPNEPITAFTLIKSIQDTGISSGEIKRTGSFENEAK